jgi:hypothetical protein
VKLTAIDAISAMVAPVVLITTGGLLTNGLLALYGEINERMREMTRERVSILCGDQGEWLDAASLPASGCERLTEIDHQLPMLICRHRWTRDAVLWIYASLGLLGLSVIGIAAAVAASVESVGIVALAFVAAGTVVMLLGLGLAASTPAVDRYVPWSSAVCRW